MRGRWATLTNEALREANVAARIDHRSLAAQGIDREPRPSIPLMHLKMEQRGLRSEVAERLRAEYAERVQRRLQPRPGMVRRIVLIDDVITKGRTLLAAAARMQSASPSADVRAFALIRTMGFRQRMDSQVQPCDGVVRWAGGDARREP